MCNNYYWRSFIAAQDEIWDGADEEHIIYAYVLALGSKFMMETFLSLAIRLGHDFGHLFIGHLVANQLVKARNATSVRSKRRWFGRQVRTAPTADRHSRLANLKPLIPWIFGIFPGHLIKNKNMK